MTQLICNCYLACLSFFLIFKFCFNYEISSSVWCSQFSSKSKKCIFQNLCYSVETKFLFLLTEKSIISGLNSAEDFKNIYATSVTYHNDLPLKISIMTDYELPKNSIFVENAFLLHRFKPDNVMHVLHDDLLPLYSTYRELCFGNVTKCTIDYDLYFSDGYMNGPYFSLYRIFGKRSPILLSTIDKTEVLCFKQVHVGLTGESVFYQYGFVKPRGENILNNNLHEIFGGFRNFILSSLNLNSTNYSNKIVFITRKLNRKILNEKFVENAIKDVYSVKFNLSADIVKVDLSDSSVYTVLNLISSARYLIGAHGAAMFMAILMPENSAVLEIFPFGITKEGVSSLFVASKSPKSNFRYFPWENQNDLNSFLHPEFPNDFGGFRGYPVEKVYYYLNLSLLPSYTCCDDAVFLSRMYQDTVVDQSIYNVLEHFFEPNPIQISKTPAKETWYFPGSVRGIACFPDSNSLKVSWLPPINAQPNVCTYNIRVETLKRNFTLTTNLTHFHVDFSTGKSKIWIMCEISGVKGLDSYLQC